MANTIDHQRALASQDGQYSSKRHEENQAQSLMRKTHFQGCLPSTGALAAKILSNVVAYLGHVFDQLWS